MAPLVLSTSISATSPATTCVAELGVGEVLAVDVAGEQRRRATKPSDEHADQHPERPAGQAAGRPSGRGCRRAAGRRLAAGRGRRRGRRLGLMADRIRRDAGSDRDGTGPVRRRGERSTAGPARLGSVGAMSATLQPTRVPAAATATLTYDYAGRTAMARAARAEAHPMQLRPVRPPRRAPVGARGLDPGRPRGSSPRCSTSATASPPEPTPVAGRPPPVPISRSPPGDRRRDADDRSPPAAGAPVGPRRRPRSPSWWPRSRRSSGSRRSPPSRACRPTELSTDALGIGEVALLQIPPVARPPRRAPLVATGCKGNGLVRRPRAGGPTGATCPIGVAIGVACQFVAGPARHAARARCSPAPTSTTSRTRPGS